MKIQPVNGTYYVSSNLAYNMLKMAIDAVKAEKEKWQMYISMLSMKKETVGIDSSEKELLKDYNNRIENLDEKFNSRKELFYDEEIQSYNSDDLMTMLDY